jgi:hypothetical protein
MPPGLSEAGEVAPPGVPYLLPVCGEGLGAFVRPRL